MKECYICTGTSPTPWVSDCLCKDRYIHAKCLKRMLITRPDMTCPVCAAKFGNVFSTTHRRCSFCAPPVMLWTFAFGVVILFGCMCNLDFHIIQRYSKETLFDDIGVALIICAVFFNILFYVTCCAWLWTVKKCGYRALLKTPFVENTVFVVTRPSTTESLVPEVHVP